jgi:hypothetical protein
MFSEDLEQKKKYFTKQLAMFSLFLGVHCCEVLTVLKSGYETGYECFFSSSNIAKHCIDKKLNHKMQTPVSQMFSYLKKAPQKV